MTVAVTIIGINIFTHRTGNAGVDRMERPRFKGEGGGEGGRVGGGGRGRCARGGGGGEGHFVMPISRALKMTCGHALHLPLQVLYF